MALIEYENNVALLDENTASSIAFFERQMKFIKEQEEMLKNAILKEMEEKNIVKIDTDEMTITYIAPTDRETFDSKAFRKEHGDLYDEYVKMSPVKSSIRIKVKEAK